MNESPTKIQGRLWLSRETHNFLGRGRIELLEKIAQYGSINKAAQTMNMSYKAAWDAIDAMNNLSPQPLVKRVAGGKGGGGTQLTDYAHQLIAVFRAIEAEHQQFLEQLTQRFADFEQFYQLIRIITMQTSARNQFLGTVTHIKSGPVNAEIVLQLQGDDQIVAVITQDSVNYLGLKVGSQAYALIKAPQIILMSPNIKLKISARNRLCGKVIRVDSGPVNAEVILELPGGNTLKSVVTQDAIAELGIKEGMPLCGIFKASQVILAVKE
jgi:molybdate transport system regulatory protein